MRRYLQGMAIMIAVLILVTAGTVQAQQQGRFRGQTAMIICDVLVLNAEKSEKVVTAYNDVSQKVREDMRSSQPADFQSMTDEQRMEYFNKMQKATMDGLKEALKDVLSEAELGVAEEMMAKRIFMPDAELRGLRQIDLKEEQQKKLQPLAVELGKKMVPGGFRFGGQQQQDEAAREKAQKEFQEAKADFMTKAAAILSEEQNKSWKEKAAEVEKENEAMRERMRQRQQQ